MCQAGTECSASHMFVEAPLTPTLSPPRAGRGSAGAVLDQIRSSHYRFSFSPASSCAFSAASLAKGELGSGSRLARSRGLFSVVA